jgi:hypothetical protein
MSVKKRLIKQTNKYAQYQTYIDNLQTQRSAQQDQSIVPFDLAANVEQEINSQKDVRRKARNKRKANK